MDLSNLTSIIILLLFTAAIIYLMHKYNQMKFKYEDSQEELKCLRRLKDHEDESKKLEKELVINKEMPKHENNQSCSLKIDPRLIGVERSNQIIRHLISYIFKNSSNVYNLITLNPLYDKTKDASCFNLFMWGECVTFKRSKLRNGMEIKLDTHRIEKISDTEYAYMLTFVIYAKNAKAAIQEMRKIIKTVYKNIDADKFYDNAEPDELDKPTNNSNT